MTTQTSFDLSGLIHAIESSNSGYQIALYAEHAQVQIIDRDHSEPAPRIVAGRPAIARWIDDMAAPDIVHHIVDAKADRCSLNFLHELHSPDGTTIVHRFTGEIFTGQITKAFVTVEVHSGPAHAQRQPGAPTIMTDDDPDPRPRPLTHPTRPTDRSLAGNFVG